MPAHAQFPAFRSDHAKNKLNAASEFFFGICLNAVRPNCTKYRITDDIVLNFAFLRIKRRYPFEKILTVPLQKINYEIHIRHHSFTDLASAELTKIRKNRLHKIIEHDLLFEMPPLKILK